MSDIYKVQAPGGEELALKLLPFQFLSDREMVRRFRLEATQANRLNHPNITRVVGHGEDLVDHYLVMELATGWKLPDGTLALDAGELTKPLDDKVIVDMLKQACDGLEYIHSEGVIHRDIKPGNLLLFEEGQVKLADFGIARSREAITLTITGLAMGTPDYMSPEQSLGTHDLTPASDIYSLGVVMYELLAGKLPFKRSTPMATMYAHLHDQAPSLNSLRPDVPEGLRNIVMKCLEKNPEKRFKSANEMYAALERGMASPPGVEAPVLTRTEGTRGQISVAWKPVTGASDYEVELANGQTHLFGKILSVSWNSPLMLKAGDYKVRVRAYTGGQPGEWSEPAKVALPFYIGPPPKSRGTGPLSTNAGGPAPAPRMAMPPPPISLVPPGAGPILAPKSQPPPGTQVQPVVPANQPAQPQMPSLPSNYHPIPPAAPPQRGPHTPPPSILEGRGWVLWLVVGLVLLIILLTVILAVLLRR